VKPNFAHVEWMLSCVYYTYTELRGELRHLLAANLQPAVWWNVAPRSAVCLTRRSMQLPASAPDRVVVM